MIAYLTTATREKVGLEHVGTLGEETAILVTGVRDHIFECDLSVQVEQIQCRIAVGSSARSNERSVYATPLSSM